MAKKEIKNINFVYNSKDDISVEITSLGEDKKNPKTYRPDISLSVQKDGEHYFIDYEKNKAKSTSSGISIYDKVNFYDRETASLEGDSSRAKILTEIFSKEENNSVLLIDRGYSIDTFENFDSNGAKYSFKYSTDLSNAKNIEDFSKKFYTSNINSDFFELMNSFNFSITSSQIIKELLDLFSTNMAKTIQLRYPTEFPSITGLSNRDTRTEMFKYLRDKYVFKKHEIEKDSLFDATNNAKIEDFINHDKDTNNLFEGLLEILDSLTEKRVLMSYTSFERFITENRDLQKISLIDENISDLVNKIKHLSFNYLISNPSIDNLESLGSIADDLKSKGISNLVIQKSFQENPSTTNLVSFQVLENDTTNTLTPLLKLDEKSSLKKILDIRGMEQETEEEVLNRLISGRIKNTIIITEDKNKAIEYSTLIFEGNVIELDSPYLGSDSSSKTYIVDIKSSLFSTRQLGGVSRLSDTEKENNYKNFIKIPDYNAEVSIIKNIEDAKRFFLDKVISQSNHLIGSKAKSIDSGKVNSISEYANDFLKHNTIDYRELQKIYNENIEANIFFEYAKKNIKEYFKQNLQTVFSSLNVNKDNKAFINDFFYNNSGAKMSITDMSNSITLASHASRMPTGDIINKIAKGYNIDLPTPVKPFSLVDLNKNKLNIKEKDYVTSTKLGAMKFSYLPKTFSLTTEKEKEKLAQIIKSSLVGSNATPDFVSKQLEIIKQNIANASYLVLKNEQALFNGDRFASKEVLVLVDNNLKDIGKLNLPISDFYNQLEIEKIFDINDYVNISKLPFRTIGTISSSLSEYINDFKNSHMKLDIVSKILNENKLKGYLIEKNAHNILLNPNISSNEKDDFFSKIGRSIKLDAYYNSFMKFDSTEKLIVWIKNNSDINDTLKEKLISLYTSNFNGYELKIIEEKSTMFFMQLKRLVGANNDLLKDIEDRTFKVYHDKVQERKAIIKTAKIYTLQVLLDNSLTQLRGINPSMPNEDRKELEKTMTAQLRGYLEVFGIDIMGLKSFQFEEALNFAGLKDTDKKNTQMLFWEMRQGKTRASIFSKLLTSFLHKKGNARALLFVQNKNIDDIAEQMFDMLPIMGRDTIYLGASKGVYNFDSSKSVELPLSISERVMPQLISMLKPVIKYQHLKDTLKSDSVLLAETYTDDINKISMQSSSISEEDLKIIYKDSEFVKLLDLCKTYKGDKTLKETIKVTFLYTERLREIGYLKDTDYEFIKDNLEKFISKYNISNEKLKKLELSNYGVDIAPKNMLYSINVDSPITKINSETRTEKNKISNNTISSPFQLNYEERKEFFISDFNIKDEKQQAEIKEIFYQNYDIPDVLRKDIKKGIVNFISNATSDVETSTQKSVFLNNELKISMKELGYGELINNEAGQLLSHYIEKQMASQSKLSISPVYKISGYNDDIEDTAKINLKQIFNKETLEEFFEKYRDEDTNTSINELVEKVVSDEVIQYISETTNKIYYHDILFKTFYTPLASTIGKRLELISPLMHRKAKNFASDFSMEIKLKGNILPLPIATKFKEDKKTKEYLLETVALNANIFDVTKIAETKLLPISGLSMTYKIQAGYPHFVIHQKQEEAISLNLSNVIKKNTNLNNLTVIDLKSDLKEIAIDEAHKGLKASGTNIKMHDITSYLHKITHSNNGSFTSMSGTPISGMAKDIGKIITTGNTFDESEKITKNISDYCTTYQFKEEIDAIIFNALEMFPKGETEKALTNYLMPKTAKTIKKSITDEELKLIKKETDAYIDSIGNIDADEKHDLKSGTGGVKHLARALESFHSNLQIDKVIQKLLKEEENINRGIFKKTETNDKRLRTFLYENIKVFAKTVAGVNNYTTLSDIVRKVGSNNSISISRPSENVKYDILDMKVILKLIEEKDLTRPSEINLDKINDKILTIGAVLSSYSQTLELGTIKSRISELFSAWTIDTFSKNNIELTLSDLGLDKKVYTGSVINDLLSKSGKSVDDSLMDVFNKMYFGSITEKDEILSDIKLKSKVDFVNTVMNKFINFTRTYNEFFKNASEQYENVKAYADESSSVLKEEDLILTVDGLEYNVSRYYSINPELENFRLFSGKETENIVSVSNNGNILIDNSPIAFKAELNINKWFFLKKGIDVIYNFTNKDEHEILESLAPNSAKLYKSHIDKGENIRVMSSRNYNLVGSFLDTVEACITREDTSKKSIIILNKNHSKHIDFYEVIENINPNLLAEKNIEIKISSSTTFSSVLNEAQKNKNAQISVVGNYVALAEGVAMDIIDTGFYVGSLRESAETIQSFARQRGNGKEESAFYLINNGDLKKLKLKGLDKYTFLSEKGLLKSFARHILNDKVDATLSRFCSSLQILDNRVAHEVLPSIVSSTFNTIARLEAYEAVMSGKYPKETIDYTKKGLIDYSYNYISQNSIKETNSLNQEVITCEENTKEISLDEEEIVFPTR